MKKVVLNTLLALSLTTMLNAKDSNYMDRIVKLWNLKTNGEIEFNKTKVDGGYNLIISSKSPFYKEVFSKKPIKISVDEGPIITSPSFGFGTAGLVAKGNILDILNPKLTKDINKTLKSNPTYKYEGKVSFGNEYKSTFEIEPFKLENDDVKIDISKVLTNSTYDLDTFTGKESIKIDSINIKPIKEEGLFKLKDISINTEILQEPIDDILLFGKSTFNIKDIEINAKAKNSKEFHTKFSAVLEGNTIRVDRDLLNLKAAYNIKALDEKTIALSKGVKESSLDLEFKKLGIKGVIEFIKLSKKLQKVNEELATAAEKNDDIAMQKAILATQEISDKMVPIWNKIFITNKSEIVLDLELKSDKTSYIKLDLIYKGKPLSGNAQSAVISLMAQQLNLFDGKFDIAVDSNLASTINPFALMGLDMLKAKGFVDVKNGIYYLKGELKNGKIVIKGKAYTIKELSEALFK